MWWPQRKTFTIPAALSGTGRIEIVQTTGLPVKCYATRLEAQQNFRRGECVHMVQGNLNLASPGDIRFLVRKSSNIQTDCWSVTMYATS